MRRLTLVLCGLAFVSGCSNGPTMEDMKRNALRRKNDAETKAAAKTPAPKKAPVKMKAKEQVESNQPPPRPSQEIAPAPPPDHTIPPPQEEKPPEPVPPIPVEPATAPALAETPQSNPIPGGVAKVERLPEGQTSPRRVANPLADPGEPLSSDDSPSAADDDQRHPLPNDDERTSGQKVLAELYQARYENARAPLARRRLAQTIFSQAQAMPDDPAGRYLMLELVQNIAVSIGDARLAWSAYEALAADYKIETLDARLTLLESLSRQVPRGETAHFLTKCQLAIEAALQEDDFETMSRVFEAALVAARRNGLKAEAERIAASQKSLDEIKAAYAHVPAARNALKANQHDPSANLILGRYLCFYHRDWSTGLRHLARGTDIKLRVLSRIDLEMPLDPAQQADLGDQWYELAQKAEKFAQHSILLHAGQCYQSALRELPNGLRKARVQKRLDDIGFATGDQSLTKK